MFTKLDDAVSVAGQLTPDQMQAAADAGFVLVINNRPDQEQAGQPSGAEIQAAAEAAGLRYLAIPVGQGGMSQPQVDAMQAALGDATGPVLAFCRSGTRSTMLWAIARSRLGDAPDALVEKAANGGYDLTPVRPFLGTV